MPHAPRTPADPRSTDGGASLGVPLAGTSALLAALAVAGWWLGRRAERRHPPAGRFITIDGVRLHYLDRGGGPSLVLLHGMGSLLQDFATSILDDLARDHRVLAIDRPGYGYSERPGPGPWTPRRQARLLCRAAQALGIERPVLLGHSFGATVALAWAAEAPDRVAGLVLLGGYYAPVRRLDAGLAAVFRLPLLGFVLRCAVAPFLLRAAMPIGLRRVVFAPNPVPRAFVQGFPLSLGYREASIAALVEDGTVLRAATAALCPDYAGIAAPALILAGMADRVIDAPGHAKGLLRRLPRAALRLLPGTGHMIHHAAPGAVRDALHEIERMRHDAPIIGAGASPPAVRATPGAAAAEPPNRAAAGPPR